MQEEKLIFIVSQPRSGSTMLQKLISNNSYVDTVSEPWILLPFLTVYKPEIVDAKYNYTVALDGVFDYLSKKDLTAKFKSSFKEFLLGLYTVAESNQYFVDKTPRYYEIVEQMYELFPNAKYIVLKRNPFAALHSMINTWFGDVHKPSSFETFYRDFLIGPFALQNFLDKYGKQSNVKEVVYENLIAEPDSYVKDLYSWLEIPYSGNELNIGENEKVKGIYGDDVYKKEPLKKINTGKADAWRTEMKNKDLSTFFADYQNFLSEDFIKRFGYTPEKFDESFNLFPKKKPFNRLINNLKERELI